MFASLNLQLVDVLLNVAADNVTFGCHKLSFRGPEEGI